PEFPGPGLCRFRPGNQPAFDPGLPGGTGGDRASEEDRRHALRPEQLADIGPIHAALGLGTALPEGLVASALYQAILRDLSAPPGLASIPGVGGVAPRSSE